MPHKLSSNLAAIMFSGGRVIEVHIGTLLADQAFTFTDWTAGDEGESLDLYSMMKR